MHIQRIDLENLLQLSHFIHLLLNRHSNFSVLSMDEIGISCLTSSPFIKPITRINFVFCKSTFSKLIFALTTSLLSSYSSSFCAKDNSYEEDKNNMLDTNEITVERHRI